MAIPRTWQKLTADWTIARDPENRGRKEQWFNAALPEARGAPVPGVVQQVFPGYHGVAWYWHTFHLPRAAQADERVVLRFGAVDYLAEVWVNGTPVGGYEGGETPFELDITKAVVTADNLLAVRVLNPTNERIDGYTLQEIPHRNKTVPPRCGAAFNSGGIMYPVELGVVPAVRIADVFARPSVKTNSISVTLTVRNDGTADARGSLAVEVAPAASGELIQADSLRTELPPGLSEYELALVIPQPRLWNLDDPFLYRLTAILEAGERHSHQFSVRCGFRDFRVVNGYFQLNGRRVFLKSTHTGNCMPIGQQVAVLPDHVRRDLLFAKASGFNMVRFIAGVAYPEQLDFCDEIGLMVYEECFAGWCLADSPNMGERFNRSTSDMIRRDRNHPCVTIWGLLNETPDGPVFRQAVDFLPQLRQLDDTRLVLLGSGRWDTRQEIGSVSNPGRHEWEPVWGAEGPDAPTDRRTEGFPGGYFDRAGDAHVYPVTPHTPQVVGFIRTLGRDTRPVFLSEYGIGSLMNVIREWRYLEQVGAHPDLEDVAILRAQSEKLYADWKRLGFEGVYPFPEDLLRESQRLHSRQRTLGFDLVRSNPQLNGFNLTGMLDHAITGEGLWTYGREWKPGTFDAVSDGWSPLRWCLFVDPLHAYRGRTFKVEAALATEDVLQPGEYPVCGRIFGPEGIVWEQAVTIHVPEPGEDGYKPLAVPGLEAEVRLDGPAGPYLFAADMEGAAPTGGRLTFHVSDPATLPRLEGQVSLWGLDDTAEAWLKGRGLQSRRIGEPPGDMRELVLVGQPADAADSSARWRDLAERMARGSVVLFLEPAAFARGEDSVRWLPLVNKGRCYTFSDWLYHKECVANRHPVFDGLPAPGIMNWDYYGPVIPHEVFEGQDTPEETIAAAFATGYYGYEGGYGSSLLIAVYRFGEGRFILSTPRILENLNVHPAADRLLVNLIGYAQQDLQRPLVDLPTDFSDRLRELGYDS